MHWSRRLYLFLSGVTLLGLAFTAGWAGLEWKSDGAGLGAALLGLAGVMAMLASGSAGADRRGP